MIFKDLVNQNEANTHPKPIPKKNEAGEGLLALFFKDSYGFGPPSFAPECYPNPFKKVSRKKQHTGCILWEPSPLHARACTGHGVRRVPPPLHKLLKEKCASQSLDKDQASLPRAEGTGRMGKNTHSRRRASAVAHKYRTPCFIMTRHTYNQNCAHNPKITNIRNMLRLKIANRATLLALLAIPHYACIRTI